jgi:hypothetical protein
MLHRDMDLATEKCLGAGITAAGSKGLDLGLLGVGLGAGRRVQSRIGRDRQKSFGPGMDLDELVGVVGSGH